MKGRTEENIRKSFEKMHKLAEIIFDEKLEVIPSYVEDKPPKDSKEAIWYLSKSIEKLAEADYFIGIKYSSYKGCNAENKIASIAASIFASLFSSSTVSKTISFSAFSTICNSLSVCMIRSIVSSRSPYAVSDSVCS